MSLRPSTSVRFGNLGFLSVGVIAFALVTLQGCAAPTVTASSAREPGSPMAGLGALRADEPARAAPREPAERPSAARFYEPKERSVRTSYTCSHCQ
jgi:hypothetical protein